ncbi:MAG TPA: alpha/beta hydrolase, partial [Chitinophagales bacterium]
VEKVLRTYKFMGQLIYDRPLLARTAFEKLCDKLPQYESGFTYKKVEIENFKAEWVIPENAESDKVLLYFHGGGYATGSIKTHRPLVNQLVKYSGVAALSVEYALAPEAQFPTQINQCTVAYKYLLSEGFSPENIAFGGESAGGGLVAGTLLWLKDKKLPQPACAILLSPWLDLTASGNSFVRKRNADPMLPYKGIPVWAENYAPGNTTHPYASPLFGELSGLCPMYIQVGENEVLLDDSVRFAEKAKKAKVDMKIEIWKDMFHAFQGFWLVLEQSQQANKKLGKYIKEKLKVAKLQAA